MKKLQLKKKVVANLSAPKMQQVIGGQPDVTKLCFTGIVNCVPTRRCDIPETVYCPTYDTACSC